MIHLRVRGTKSWLDPRSQFALSRNLSTRLVDRCRGRRGVFVTLTYRRGDFDGPQDLYRKTSEDQHVPLFLRKVGRHLGVNLKGKWFCKLEFQRGGWVHWHIIILDVHKIKHDVLTRMWGHGHTWINRLSPHRIRYCCKYVCKGGAVSSWLYAEPTRGVKVVRVSPGFWCDTPIKKQEVAARWQTQLREECHTWRPPRMPFWKSIGQRIEESRDELVAKDEDGKYRRVIGDFGSVLVSLIEGGHTVVGNDRGWVVIDCSWDELDYVAGRLTRTVPLGTAASRLHLTECRNPDTGKVPAWVKGILADLICDPFAGKGVAC